MVDPFLALASTALVAAALAALFWPVHGLYWRAQQSFRLSKRVLIEDALKHVHNCEYNKLPCTLHSLSGALNISGNRAADILAQLERMEMTEPSESGYRLTPEGRSYALRVIRNHRLLERFFSDQTSLAAAEWHNMAEYHEHKISDQESETMATQMGYPRFDPHGDPIPTAKGDIPPPQGLPLTELPINQLAEIVHVEDEPPAVHAQLLAEDLHPGKRVRVSEATPHRIRFEADSEEHVLAPIVASHLSVIPLSDEQKMEGPFENLSSLEPGRQAEVIGISAICRGPERRRLLDLGIIPGTIVEVDLESPSRDPVAYKIRGTVIAMRLEQAAMVHVSHTDTGDR